MTAATRQQELERLGWQRMTTIDEPRLSELVDAYRRLGHEVHLEPVHPDDEDECTACIAAEAQLYCTIYIRQTGTDDSDDLYENLMD